MVKMVSKWSENTQENRGEENIEIYALRVLL